MDNGYIPGGVNLAVNPSFELNISGWSVGNIGGSPATVDILSRNTNWSWSEKYAGYTRINGPGSNAGFYFSHPSPVAYSRILVSPGQPYSLSIRAMVNLVGQTEGYAFTLLTFKNALDEAIGTTIFENYTDFTSGVPFTLKFENFVPPVGTVYFVPVFHFMVKNGVMGTGSEGWVDGLQVNPGEFVDSYIDGAQGPSYGWNGVVAFSTSYRLPSTLQGPTGVGGVITVGSRVFQSDRYNSLIEDVTDYILSGTISSDIDRDGPKTTISVAVTDPVKISRFSWVSPFYDVDRETREPTTTQVGLFRLEQPSENFDGESVVVSYGGFDPAILLSDAGSETTKLFAGGTTYISAIRGLCDELGVSHDFVNSTSVIPTAGISYPPGTSYLKMVNELLAAIGYYSVFADRIGVLTSFPIMESLRSVQPSRFYTVGENSELVGELSFNPNDDAIFNHVVVYRDDPSKGSTLIANRYFRDPNSPISVQNLGLKTKTIALQNAANQAAVNARAAKEIQDRTMYVSGMLQILPDPDIELHSVIDLDLSAMEHVPGSQDHSGRYYVNSLTYPIGVSEGTMKLGIRRIERTDE